MNISSLIVHARPESGAVLRARLAAIRGVEIHAVADDGRMIVTIEADDDGATSATYEAIERAEGVLAVAMVYQQTESDPEREI